MSYQTEMRKAGKSMQIAMPQSASLHSAAFNAHNVTYGSVLKQVLGLGLRMRFRKAATFTLRLVAYPVLSLRWYEFLAQFAAEHRLGLPHDDIIRKAIPNFFLYKASSRERLTWLKDHFAIAGQYMDAELLYCLWKGGQMGCATVTGKKEHYEIVLRLSDHAGARHEGGFTISMMRRSDQALLCMMSFIFVRDRGDKIGLAIGGLQGARGADAKRAVIDATRDLYGVRPKDALLLLAEGMAEACGADDFLAVGNAGHVINFRSSVRREKMRSDLDSYWEERGGVQGGRFGYCLPLRNTELREAVAKRDRCKLHFLQQGRRLLAGKQHANL